MAQHRTIAYSAELVPMLRKIGRVYDLTEEERSWIAEGEYGTSEGFAGFYKEMLDAGGPEDRRYHMRTFFNLLRDQIKQHVSISKALEAVDYESTREEKAIWEACAKAEIRHTAYCRVMAPKGSGW